MKKWCLFLFFMVLVIAFNFQLSTFNLLYAQESTMKKELCINGGFEEGRENWSLVPSPSIEIVSENVYSGSKALKLNATNLGGEINVYSMPINVLPGNPYILSSFVKQLSGDGAYKVVIDWQDENRKHIKYDNDWKGQNKPKEYTRHGGGFISPANAAKAVLILGIAKGVSCLFDNISLIEYPTETGAPAPGKDGEGSIAFEPSVLKAGSFETIKIKYKVGPSGLRGGSSIQVRRSSIDTRWSIPQDSNPKAEGYTTVKTAKGHEVFISENYGSVPQILTITFFPSLFPGDEVEIIYGDKSKGGPGVKVQPRTEDDICWIVATDADGDGFYHDAPQGTAFSVVASQVSKLTFVSPVCAEKGKSFEAKVRALDENDNIDTEYEGEVKLSSSDPGASFPVAIKFAREDKGEKKITVTFQSSGKQKLVASLEKNKGEREIVVFNSVPALSKDAPAKTSCYEKDGLLVLENKNIRIVFAGSPLGFTYCPVYVYKNGWQRMGTLKVFSEITLKDKTRKITFPLFPTSQTISNKGGRAELQLSATGILSDVKWTGKYTFLLEDNSSHATIEYDVSPDKDAQILQISGPTVYPGDGCFGQSKELALFPALEYLESGQNSSDLIGISPPEHLRFLPNPYKITIPIMAVSSPAGCIALSWDPLQKWDGKNILPSAMFWSPNRYEQLDNHLFSILAPSIPQWLPENFVGEQKPYPLKSSNHVILKSDLVLLPGDNVIEAVKYWFAKNGVPDLLKPPRSYQEDVDLCARGCIETAWDAKERGWHNALADPWGAGFNQGILLDLYHFTKLTKDDALKNKIQAQIEEARKNRTLGDFELLLYLGDIKKTTVGGLFNNASDAIGGQKEDGSWTYYAGSGDKMRTQAQLKSMGKDGEVTQGTCAYNLHIPWRNALITGNQKAIKCGLKGLKFMEKFRIPTSAEYWEVPLANPNLRAAALTVDSYLNAYIITGKSEYLEKAKYWAYTGLPFLYVWNPADRPAMRYGSISVMGSTFHTFMWFERLVQWVGLVYAGSLQRLGESDNSFPWKKIAEGILISAMYQQRTDDGPAGKGDCAHVGFYPDAWNVEDNKDAYHWCLSPKLISEVLLENINKSPKVKTKILGSGETKMHVNSPVNIKNAEFLEKENKLKLSLSDSPLDRSALAIFHTSKPENVKVDGRTFDETKKIESVASGWQYVPEYVALILKMDFPGKEIEISGVQPTTQQESKAEGKIVNGGFESDLDGWNIWETGKAELSKDAHSGKCALLLDATGISNEMDATSLPISIEGGKEYKLTSYVKIASGDGNYKVTIDWLNSDGGHISYENDWKGSNKPKEYTFHGGVFTAPASAASAKIILGVNKGTSFLFDDISLEK